MMSNTPSSLQSRQRLHKRQNSTPVAFEAMKVPMPPTTVQRHSLHRRGQSYDMARTPIRRQNHNGSAVSINTNIGPIHGQPILREAQQQKMTRPGQQPIHPQGGTSTSQQQCDFQTQPPSFARVPYEMQMSALMSMSQDMSPHSAFQNFPMTIPPEVQATLVFDENTHNYFPLPPQSQQASQLMPQQDRRMSQPDVRIRTGMRPYTPTHQIQTGKLAVPRTKSHLTNRSTFSPNASLDSHGTTAATRHEVDKMAATRGQHHIPSTSVNAKVEIPPGHCRTSRNTVLH